MFSEQEQIRRESLKKLRDLGYNPYPPEKFEVNKTSVEIKQNFSEGSSMEVVIAGRIMSRRIMGKASFMEIQDKEGKIQVYLNRDEICKGEDKTLYNIVFKKLLDIGDIVGIMGDVFITKVGEISVKAEELTILTKSLKPLPLPKKDSEGRVYDAFTDPEKRYRQRYVDLIVNPGVKDVFIKRTKLTNSMREYLNEKGYLEVETPILQPLYGGASARPFKTHHNTLDIDLYLRIANELANSQNTILYLNPSASNTKLVIYYHNSSQDSLELEFQLDNNTARVNLFNDKSDVSILNDQSYKYIQSMAGYKLLVNINGLDSIKKVLSGKSINKATMTFTIADDSQIDYPAHEKLLLVRLDDEDRNIFLTDYIIEGESYFGGTLQNGEYNFNITRYLYQLINNNSYTNKLYLLPTGSTVNANRSILNNDVQLTIHFSEL